VCVYVVYCKAGFTVNLDSSLRSRWEAMYEVEPPLYGGATCMSEVKPSLWFQHTISEEMYKKDTALELKLLL